jgi:alkylated DNA nucleotide flippase Atl1
MRHELVFTVSPGTAIAAQPVTLAEAGLYERADLQEWIRANPDILGPDLYVVTYEFDRWVSAGGSHADRLDILALDADGRLVVAELKRDGAPDTVEMQAIKYAAYASRFTPDTLAACHGAYLRRTGEPATDDEALARLEAHCGGLAPELLASPRIVLVAGSFPESVTADVVWLCEQGLAISLVQIGAYRTTSDVIVTVSRLWPLPQVEDLTIIPNPAPVVRAVARRRENRNATTVIAEAGLLADGAELELVPRRNAEAVAAWVAADHRRGRATWCTDERVRVLRWAADGERYSPSGLAELILAEAAGVDASLNGAQWWAADGVTLAEIARGQASHDWSGLHEALGVVAPGEWTTCGELAAVVGSSAQAVGQHLMRCQECAGAWRVLGADGRPRDGFAWTDRADTRSPVGVLEAEGLVFTADGSADPDRRVGADALRARLASV